MTTETGYPYKIRYWVLDFENLTVEVGGTAGSVISTGRFTPQFYGVQVVANMTGRFHFYWKQNDNMCHWWDLDESITERKFGSSTYFLNEIVCLENDIYIGSGHVSGTGRPFVYYQQSPEATFTMVSLEVGLRSYENGGMSMSISQGSLRVTIISYCNSDERLTKWNAMWNASAGTWQASQTDTGVSDPDDITCYGHFGALWPIHPSTSIRWTLPKAGWAVLGRDENGGTDALDMIHDNPDWTADLTTDDPEITTASLPDATYGQFYEASLTKTGGTTPFWWTLLIGPGWLSIGSSNGTIYGTPDGVGSETVRVKLADAVPRYDESEWTLTIKPASSGSDGEPGGEATSFVFDDMGEMWMLLAVTAVFVGLARTYKMAIWRRNQR
jgi:hypothetical protein